MKRKLDFNEKVKRIFKSEKGIGLIEYLRGQKENINDEDNLLNVHLTDKELLLIIQILKKEGSILAISADRWFGHLV